MRWSRADDTELRLYAAPGAPADTIMTLVQPRHTTTDPDNRSARNSSHHRVNDSTSRAEVHTPGAARLIRLG
jgi:hypothetical protein